MYEKNTAVGQWFSIVNPQTPGSLQIDIKGSVG